MWRDGVKDILKAWGPKTQESVRYLGDKSEMKWCGL